MTEHLADRSTETLVLRAGDTVLLVLEENPTTGFRWTTTVAAGAPVAIAGSDFLPGAIDRPGAGGRREIRFIAHRPGAAQIRLALTRSWSGESSDAMHLDLTIT